MIHSFLSTSSSLSSYVHKIDAMSLPNKEQKQVDDFIDNLYDEMSEGKIALLSTNYFFEKRVSLSN